MSYNQCPICGCFHDDGTFYNINNNFYFVCMDCNENFTDEDIKMVIIDILFN